jgi:hypothetical protein
MKSPSLTEEQIKYFAQEILEEDYLLNALLVFANYDIKNLGAISKQKLMIEIDRSQIIMEKSIAKLTGMLLIEGGKEKGMIYSYRLSENGRLIIRHLFKDLNIIKYTNEGVIRI